MQQYTEKYLKDLTKLHKDILATTSELVATLNKAVELQTTKAALEQELESLKTKVY